MESYRQVVKSMNLLLDEFNVLITKEFKELDDFHLTSQQEVVLIYISRRDRVTAAQIAQEFDITKSAVSQVLTKLEQQDLIEKIVNPDNRRESFIVLGKQGKRFMDTLVEIEDHMIEKYYSKVKMDDLIHMTNTIEEINQVIKKNKK
ncbi:MarR family transcriptional regulator [Paenibacillus polygoni]|uniref:MarR family transcriptional regulator n=1 Tax=Paenibacillus polygoni TaxID=3050112 RepID=A0ABY8XAA5_9BACL|nr:MarR family transcriptional regulator [Paenibacillus polygoni]WIV21068.1 MarR family transcriptional regulator [Paenibacillus polygoni]